MAQKRAVSEIDSIKAKILAREKFLDKVVKFAIFILDKEGECLKNVTYSSHTNIIERLLNFEGFSFHGDFGQGMMGGNDIRIWHHLGQDFFVGENVIPDVNQPVLHVRYSGTFETNKCQVKVFDEGLEWQEALLELIRNKNKVLTAIKRKESRETALARAASEKQRELNKPKEQARNLGINIQEG